MKSIYASKLYKASKYKNRIHAALLSPGNLELVQQLAEDLDEEYQTDANLTGESKDASSDDTQLKSESNFDDMIVDDEDFDPAKDLVTLDDMQSSTPSSHSSHSAPSKHNDTEDKPESNAKSEPSDLIPESPANEIEKPQSDSEKEPAEASTKIQSCTAADLNILKGTLNSREDTAGVNRISEKDDEIWIYYSDDINLNNVMTDVIEFMIVSGYTWLEFNRLARTDNAIVFCKVESTLAQPAQVRDVEEIEA